jgi:hypothetical protein
MSWRTFVKPQKVAAVIPLDRRHAATRFGGLRPLVMNGLPNEKGMYASRRW